MSPIVREYYRVPRGHHESYIHPAAPELPALVGRNRLATVAWAFSIAGRPIREFRAAARAEVMALARQYTERWKFDADPSWTEPMPIVMTGHQPPPFHPGVWIKNFLAGSLAGSVGGAGINLTVDNDEARGQVLRYPTRLSAGGDEMAGPRVDEVPFAPPSGGAALEEQPSEALRPEVIPHIRQFAPSVLVEAAARFVFELIPRLEDDASLAESLAAARRALEDRAGLRNLELPVSRLADTESFRLFAAEMLRRHEDLFAAYNDSLAEYRRVYHERSAAQPVPDLARDGPRAELPLWVWRAGEPRRHLWVERQNGGDLLVYANNEPVGGISAGDAASDEAVAAQLAAWRKAGWKVRPRALSLTLFVRAAVADVFIHGLGGALYDKITDGLFERFFGVRPPEVILASCTVCLPMKSYPATARDLFDARRAVRDWRYNPDLRLSAAARERPDVRALIDEKWRLLAGMIALPRPDRRAPYQRVHAINAALAQAEPDGPRLAAERLARVERELAYNAILQGREYPFFFYDCDELAAYYRTISD
jgi:hypothetical protein